MHHILYNNTNSFIPYLISNYILLSHILLVYNKCNNIYNAYLPQQTWNLFSSHISPLYSNQLSIRPPSILSHKPNYKLRVSPFGNPKVLPNNNMPNKLPIFVIRLRNRPFFCHSFLNWFSLPLMIFSCKQPCNLAFEIIVFLFRQTLIHSRSSLLFCYSLSDLWCNGYADPLLQSS